MIAVIAGRCGQQDVVGIIDPHQLSDSTEFHLALIALDPEPNVRTHIFLLQTGRMGKHSRRSTTPTPNEHYLRSRSPRRSDSPKPKAPASDESPITGHDLIEEEEERRSREFGHLMAREGATSHVSTIILLMYVQCPTLERCDAGAAVAGGVRFDWVGRCRYGAIAGFSALWGWLSGGKWWTQLAFYFFGLVAFYAWHAMAHTRFFRPMCDRPVCQCAAGTPHVSRPLLRRYRIHMRHHLRRFPPG